MGVDREVSGLRIGFWDILTFGVGRRGGISKGVSRGGGSVVERRWEGRF